MDLSQFDLEEGYEEVDGFIIKEFGTKDFDYKSFGGRQFLEYLSDSEEEEGDSDDGDDDTFLPANAPKKTESSSKRAPGGSRSKFMEDSDDEEESDEDDDRDSFTPGHVPKKMKPAKPTVKRIPVSQRWQFVKIGGDGDGNEENVSDNNEGVDRVDKGSENENPSEVTHIQKKRKKAPKKKQTWTVIRTPILGSEERELRPRVEILPDRLRKRPPPKVRKRKPTGPRKPAVSAVPEYESEGEDGRAAREARRLQREAARAANRPSSDRVKAVRHVDCIFPGCEGSVVAQRKMGQHTALCPAWFSTNDNAAKIPTCNQHKFSHAGNRLKYLTPYVQGYRDWSPQYCAMVRNILDLGPTQSLDEPMARMSLEDAATLVLDVEARLHAKEWVLTPPRTFSEYGSIYRTVRMLESLRPNVQVVPVAKLLEFHRHLGGGNGLMDVLKDKLAPSWKLYKETRARHFLIRSDIREELFPALVIEYRNRCKTLEVDGFDMHMVARGPPREYRPPRPLPSLYNPTALMTSSLGSVSTTSVSHAPSLLTVPVSNSTPTLLPASTTTTTTTTSSSLPSSVSSDSSVPVSAPPSMPASTLSVSLSSTTTSTSALPPTSVAVVPQPHDGVDLMSAEALSPSPTPTTPQPSITSPPPVTSTTGSPAVAATDATPGKRPRKPREKKVSEVLINGPPVPATPELIQKFTIDLSTLPILPYPVFPPIKRKQTYVTLPDAGHAHMLAPKSVLSAAPRLAQPIESRNLPSCFRAHPPLVVASGESIPGSVLNRKVIPTAVQGKGSDNASTQQTTLAPSAHPYVPLAASQTTGVPTYAPLRQTVASLSAQIAQSKTPKPQVVSVSTSTEGESVGASVVPLSLAEQESDTSSKESEVGEKRKASAL